MSGITLKNQYGGFYIEVLISVSILAIIGASILPLYPRLLRNTKTINDHSQLLNLAQYVGDYVYRWANFSPQTKAKTVPFEFYSDGNELELSGEKRINRLLWADPLTEGQGAIPDTFKTSIQFWETTSRNNSAVIRVLVWQDTDLDDTVDTGEPQYSFSTMVTEKYK